MNQSREDLTNAEIVSLALSALGGAANPIGLEDVALEAFRVVPNRFSWKKFSDRIDLRIVAFSLQAATKKRPGYIQGDAKKGYMLTQKGIDFVEGYVGDIRNILDKPRKDSAEDQLIKEKARLKKSSAFLKYRNDRIDEITQIEFQEFSRVNDYFPPHLLQQRFLKIENAIRGDIELVKLWAVLSKKFLEGN